MLSKFLQDFNLDAEQFDTIVADVTRFVHKRHSGNIGCDGAFADASFTSAYLDDLSDEYDEYCEFGADKCGVDDFMAFCKELDIDLEYSITKIVKAVPDKHIATRYNFYSKKRDLVFTCSSTDFMSGYFHYFGLTGEKDAVLKAYDRFSERAYYAEINWIRDYI